MFHLCCFHRYSFLAGRPFCNASFYLCEYFFFASFFLSCAAFFFCSFFSKYGEFLAKKKHKTPPTAHSSHLSKHSIPARVDSPRSDSALVKS